MTLAFSYFLDGYSFRAIFLRLGIEQIALLSR